MSHTVRTDRPSDKKARYVELGKEIAAVLEGESNRVAQMATVASMLNDAFETFFWTGFYVVDPEKPGELVVGPYQGTLGCLRIPFGKGVCGAAAVERKTQIVADVHAFPGHIACDSRSRSEIVLPVFNGKSELIAVLDVDSTEYGAFDETDGEQLAGILHSIFSRV